LEFKLQLVQWGVLGEDTLKRELQPIHDSLNAPFPNRALCREQSGTADAIANPNAATSISWLPIRSESPQITPDGRYVAFLSTATNLVPGVTTVGEVYVRDLTGGVTFLASTNAHTVFSGSVTPASCNHTISDNGQFVAFESFASLSFPSSTAGIIQRYHLQTGFTDVVYSYSNTVITPTGYPLVRDLDMTPDGRFIAFAVNSNDSDHANSIIYLWDAQTATATLVSCDTNNEVPSSSISDKPAVNSSGQFVVFLSNATGLTTNDVAGGFHLYLRDLLAGATTLLDADTNGTGFTKNFMNPPHLTPDGRYVAFDCTDGNLVTSDNNLACDVFVRDLTTNTIELISVRQPTLPSQTPGGFGAATIFSMDVGGRYIAFASAVDSLAPNYTNLCRGVLVHDFLNGKNLLASVGADDLANAASSSSAPSLSGNGRYVAFTSSATNLVAGDNINVMDVFVRDLQSETTSLISINCYGTGSGNGDSYSPVISANGQYVLFRSWAGNLVGPPFSSIGENLFLRDLQAGKTYALTISSGGAGYSASFSIVPLASMTQDGHFVAFYGDSPIAAGQFFVWDSQAAALIYTNSSVSPATIAISPDGNRILYSTSGGCYAVDRVANTNWQIGGPLSSSHAGLQFSSDARFLAYATAFDTNGVADVYLYDFVTSSNFLVSQGNPPGSTNGPSDSPAISNDGRFVAYRSTATNLVAGVTNGLPNVFLYDRQTGTTTLLSFNASGTAGNNRSFAPQFSGDGQTVVFQTWASDLIAQDYNQVNDLVALKIATSNPTPVFIGQMVFAPATLQSPTLTWPAENGKTYEVQYRDNLTDAGWQTLNGNTWVSGNQGYATDLAPNTGQRFYRVLAF